MFRLLINITLSILILPCAFANEKLIFAIDIVRHGDRTPVLPSPEMQKIWPQGAGQLTPKGMQQTNQLGKQLRQQYIEQYPLLPQHYDINTMQVRSSGLPRTLMSAQSLLLGLYPLGTGPILTKQVYALPDGFQPIPIQTVPQEQDTLLIPNHDKKVYYHLLETHLFNDPEWIEKEKKIKHYFPTWSKNLDLPINHLFDLINISDRLYIEQLYHLPPSPNLQQKDAALIIEAGNWAMLKIMNHPQLAFLVGHELAHTIAEAMQKASQKDQSLRYMLFVAHDTTIAAQLKLLEQPINTLMPYTSQLHYALFDLEDSHYEIRVSFNQKPLFIKRCKANGCPLPVFLELINGK